MYPRVGVLCGSGGIVGYGCWCDRHHLLIHPQHRATQPIVGHPSVHYSFSGYGAPSPVRWRISWHISMVPWLGWVVIHLSYLCAGILVHVFRVTDGRSGDSNHHSKAPPHRYLNPIILWLVWCGVGWWWAGVLSILGILIRDKSSHALITICSHHEKIVSIISIKTNQHRVPPELFHILWVWGSLEPQNR